MVAANEAVKLIIEDIVPPTVRLERQAFFLAAGRIGPEDFFRHFEPGRSSLGENLKPGLRQEGDWRRPMLPR